MKPKMNKMFALPGPYPERAVIDAIRRLMLIVRSSAPFMALMSLPVVVVFWGDVPTPWLLVWWAAALTVPCGWYVLARAYFAREARVGAPDLAWSTRQARRLSIVAAYDGLVWGTACLSILVVRSIGHQLLVLVLTVGNTAGSIFATSYWPATQYLFVIPAIGLPIMALIITGDAASLGVATGLAVYMVILHFVTRDAYKTTMDGIEIQIENQELVEKLRVQTQLAEQANAAKSKFLAAASHDLRQPLHALGLFVDMLRERVTEAEVQRLLGKIDQSTLALGGLLDTLLDLSKIDAGIVDPHVRHVSLSSVLGQIVAEYEPQARAKSLDWYCNGMEVVVRTDPVLLETILRNLISNALRYTHTGGIGIKCHSIDSEVRIDVSDTGIGVDVEHHRDIFREFFQLHNPERDRAKGLGLGLTIVDRLTNILDHRLELHSVPGEGTTFTLTLPAGDSAQTTESDDMIPVADHSDAKGMTVLVVEDERDTREAMLALLEGWGYATIAVASLDEALRHLAGPPEAIIADYRLRDEQTGIAAVHALRQHFGVDIAALIVTGDTAASRIGEIAQNDLAMLHKPVRPAKLRAFLRGVRNRSV